MLPSLRFANIALALPPVLLLPETSVLIAVVAAVATAAAAVLLRSCWQWWSPFCALESLQESWGRQPLWAVQHTT
jgi:hypothetical protein